MADETEHTGPAAPDAAGDAAHAPALGELPPTAIALAGTAKDLKALRDAVVDAAGVGAGLWFSYLFVLFYLLIAAGGVTHRDLLLQSPVKLPFLNVDLPLLGFFWLGPLIFLIVHAYVLLHFVLLAGKVGDFDAELRVQIPDEEVRRRLRRQLPSNIFVQFLAGSREVRTGVMGFMLRLIAQISLVIGPIALLVFFELQFLPYHDWAITWWHRIAVIADIGLLWMLWPSIARGETIGLSRADLLHPKILVLAFASLAPVLLVTMIATFPGEWLEDNLPPPWKSGEDSQASMYALLHELLVAGEIDFAARKPKSLWSNRLVLPGFDAIDHTKFDNEAKIEALPETIFLRARHLEGAVLIDAKLRKADFTGAQLQGAQLDDSDLRGAKFKCSSTEPPRQCAQLQNARMNGADLGGAMLRFAKLQGAQFQGADLRGASLYDADLRGAKLYHADLRGAKLDDAHLWGASLEWANLGGASLFYAQLQGASLNDADLRGASLNGAQLQGASLDHAELDGAVLDNSVLQGALLDDSVLIGTSLIKAQLQGASLIGVWIWRTDITSAIWKDTRVKLAPETSLKHALETLEYLKKLTAIMDPKGGDRRDLLERIEQELNPKRDWDDADYMAKDWEAQKRSSPAPGVYEKRLAGIWQETGCAPEGAPYVLRGLLRRLDNREITDPSHTSPFDAQSPQLPALAKAFLDEEQCPGAHGLTDAEKAMLKAIRDRSPPPAPKP